MQPHVSFVDRVFLMPRYDHVLHPPVHRSVFQFHLRSLCIAFTGVTSTSFFSHLRMLREVNVSGLPIAGSLLRHFVFVRVATRMSLLCTHHQPAFCLALLLLFKM